MKKILVVCPICNKSKRIIVPESIFELEEGSLLKILIKKNQVCSHEFGLLLDFHFSIRDYELDEKSLEKIRKSHSQEDLSIFDIMI